MDELTLAHRVVVPEAVVSRELEGETILLNLETGIYFGLDGVATDFFTASVAGGTLQDACNQLLTQYDADAATIADDLLRLVNQMAAKGLVQAG